MMLTLVTRAGSLRFINGWFVQQSPLHFSCVVARGEKGERWPEAWPRPASKTLIPTTYSRLLSVVGENGNKSLPGLP